MATEGTSGVQGYPLWDRDEVKSNVDKMEKELEMGGEAMGARPTTDETQGIWKVDFEERNLEVVNLKDSEMRAVGEPVTTAGISTYCRGIWCFRKDLLCRRSSAPHGIHREWKLSPICGRKRPQMVL